MPRSGRIKEKRRILCRYKGRKSRINKGEGREWKGVKICAGEWGEKGKRRIDVRGG